MEGRRADLGVGSLSGYGRLHLHVAAFRRAGWQAWQVFDGGVRVLAVQRAAAYCHCVLQLCEHRGRGEEAEVNMGPDRGGAADSKKCRLFDCFLIPFQKFLLKE